MLEGAAQILEHTNCLASGGVWLLFAATVNTPTVSMSLPAPAHCRSPGSELEPYPKDLRLKQAPLSNGVVWACDSPCSKVCTYCRRPCSFGNLTSAELPPPNPDTALST